ncbi:unnamed protein product [Ilex paraguariensis]|uniref:Dihydrodipicolinate reductase N-terminal domain-containing protein n=1 Tax=Ilex paraguariensis TaxID=185542 RepID=A0ABC8V3P1_9AQUA
MDCDIFGMYFVNGCTGKMGKAVVEAAVSAGIHIVPVSFGGLKNAGNTVQVGGKDIQMYGPYERERILASTLNDYPNLIVVDYTVPAAVNDNVELYCKIGVPFVMGTTGGDRNRLYKTVESSKVYAVISPQMGKQLVAFLATMENMAENFPGVFSGYTLQVMESHQAGKLDTSGTAKVVISYFQKLGVSFEVDQKLSDNAENGQCLSTNLSLMETQPTTADTPVNTCTGLVLSRREKDDDFQALSSCSVDESVTSSTCNKPPNSISTLTNYMSYKSRSNKIEE